MKVANSAQIHPANLAQSAGTRSSHADFRNAESIMLYFARQGRQQF